MITQVIAIIAPIVIILLTTLVHIENKIGKLETKIDIIYKAIKLNISDKGNSQCQTMNNTR